MDFYVIESATGGSTATDWAVVGQSSDSYNWDPGLSYADSGYLGDVTLVAGYTYGFVTAWMCDSATEYHYAVTGAATDLGSPGGGYFYLNDYSGDWSDFSFIGSDLMYVVDVVYN